MLELVAVLAQTLACVSKSSCCLKASVLLVAMSAAEVQKQIDGNGPILNRLEIACNLLREMNLLQELDVLPEKVLCHPCNRGGLGLNPHNAHRTGAKVQSIGADLKQLDTYLFTMPPAGAVAAKHIKFNEELVSIAEGMLAPVNGHELYTSVAGGHFEAFCKAANAGCKTNQKNIMDEQGNIDVGKLKKDFVFKKLLEKGWRCMVIDGHAEELIPGLPDFIQRAKNAHNSIASEASETEVCVSINEFASNMQKLGNSINWDTCIDAATTGNPPCIGYAKVLAKYCSLYSGGVGAPELVRLDKFAKRQAANAKLGEEFWTAVVDVNFGETTPCPRIRSAMLACNMTSPKVQDGISKLLLKADILGLAKKEKLPMVLDFEKSLATCADLVEKLGLSVDENTKMKLDNSYILMMVRGIAHLCNKEHLTFEGEKHDSLNDIMKLFFTAVDCNPGEAPAPSAPASKASTILPEVVTMDMVGDPQHIAAKKGFTKDGIVYNKELGHSSLFIIKQLDTMVELESREFMPNATVKKHTMPVPQFLKEWSLWKGSLNDLPFVVENDVVITHTITNTINYIQDVARIGLFHDLTSYASKNGSNGHAKLLYTMNPFKVYAKNDIKDEELVLVPQVDLDHIKVAKQGKAPPACLKIDHPLDVRDEKLELYILKTAVPKPAEVKELKPSNTFAFNPFFMVDTTSDKKSANVTYYVEQHCDFKVPMYYNHRRILANEPILSYAPPENPAKKQKTSA